MKFISSTALLSLVLNLVLLLGHQAARAGETNSGFWFGTFVNKKIDDRFSANLETQIRNEFDTGVVKQFLYRAGFNYALSETQSIGALFGIIQTGLAVERRLAFQHQMAYLKSETSELTHRVRLEGRNFENSSNDSVRLRYQLRHSRDVNADLKGVVWSEIFMNVSDETSSGQAAVERLRIFAGVRTPLLGANAEFGYLNQTVYRQSLNTTDHLAVIYWFL